MLRSSIRLQTVDYTNQKNYVKDINENTDTKTNMDPVMPEIKESSKTFELKDPPKSKNMPSSSPQNVDDKSVDAPNARNNSVPKVENQTPDTDRVSVQAPGYAHNGTVVDSNEHSFEPQFSHYRKNPMQSGPSIRSDISVMTTTSTMSTDSYRVAEVGGSPVRIRSDAKALVKRRKNRGRNKAAIDRRISCQDLGMGECEGWLYKKEDKRGLGNKWPKRWCVLKDYSVFYYKDKNALIASGVISIPGYRISQASPSDTKRPFAFKVSHPKVRDFIFASDSLTDMSKWMNKLSLASITYDYKEEEEAQRMQKPRVIPEYTDPLPSPALSTTSECPYFSESEGEEDKSSSPSGSVKSSLSDLTYTKEEENANDETQLKPLDHKNNPTQLRIQDQREGMTQGQTEEPAQGQTEKHTESECQDEKDQVQLDLQDKGQNQSEGEGQVEEHTQLESQGQTDDLSEEKVDDSAKFESSSQVDNQTLSDDQGQMDDVTSSENQGQAEDHVPPGVQVQSQEQKQDLVLRATVNLPISHPDSDDGTGDVNRSTDGLLRLYGSVKMAKVKVEGVDSAISRQNMSRPERLRTFSIISRDPNKNKKVLEKRALERTLKAKESELQEIEMLLQGEINSTSLREWTEQHSDLLPKKKIERQSWRKSAQKTPKSNAKASPKSSPVSGKSKKKQKQGRKSRKQDMNEHDDDDEYDSDRSASDRNYHETHL